MKRYIGAWLVVVAVPACGANIDVGGPRLHGTAGSNASADGDGNAGKSSSGGTGADVDPIETAGTGASVAVAGSSSSGGYVAGGSAAGGSPGSSGSNGGEVVPEEGYSGAFKVLVLSKALEFAHSSIPACQELLATLGQTPDGKMPTGTTPGSQFTIDIANNDLSDFTDAKLQDYGMLFWCNPTGTVFSTGGANGKIGMAAIQKYVEGGGAWGGVHSATDFENRNGFPWFTNVLVGAYFDHHDNDGTPGTVQLAATFATHPVMRGMPQQWSTQDEWYYMNRDIRAQPGFQVLATLASDQRPVVWTKQLGAEGKGRMFYTVRGHDSAVFQEANFKKLVLNGILWATHRLQ